MLKKLCVLCTLKSWCDWNLSEQIQNLELEKIYMAKELDSLKAQSAIQTGSADSDPKTVLFQIF